MHKHKQKAVKSLSGKVEQAEQRGLHVDWDEGPTRRRTRHEFVTNTPTVVQNFATLWFMEWRWCISHVDTINGRWILEEPPTVKFEPF